MATLKEIRQAFPEYAKVPDDVLSEALYKKYGEGVEKPDFLLSLQGRGPRIGPIEAGYEGMKSSAQTGIARLLYGAGAEETGREMQQRAAERREDVAARYQPEIRSYEDVTGPVSAGQYLYEGAAQSAPYLGATAAGALAGAGVGSVVPGVGTAAGALLGAAAAQFPMFLGSNIERQMDEGKKFEETELAPAAGAAALQTAASTASFRVGAAGLLPGLAARGGTARLRNFAIRGLETGASEAVSESAQGALEIMQANPDKFFEFGPEVQKEIINQAILGGGIGFLTGGAGGALSTRTARAPEVETPAAEVAAVTEGAATEAGTTEAATAAPPPVDTAGVEAPPVEAGTVEGATIEPPAAQEPVAPAPRVPAAEPTVEGAVEPTGVEPAVEGAVESTVEPVTVEPVSPTTAQGPEVSAPPKEVVDPFKSENIPPLPKKLAAGTPKYDKFRLQFPSGIERALFQISKANPTKQDMEYRDWLKDRGLTDQEITAYGKQLRVQLKNTYKQMRGQPANAIMPVEPFVPVIPETPVQAFPVRQQPTPKPSLTLAQFVASQGGIQDTEGELSARNLSNKMTGRYGRLVRKKGMKPEQALRAAVDAGYYTVPERDEAGGYQPPREMLDQFYNDLGTDLRDVETQRLESEGLFQEREAPEVENRRQIEAAVSSAAKEFGIADPQAETLAANYIERGEVSDPVDAIERATTSLGSQQVAAQPKQASVDAPFFEDVPVYKMADNKFYDSGLVEVPPSRRSFTPIETTTVGSMLDRIKVDFEGVPGEVYKVMRDRLKTTVGDLKVQIVDAKEIADNGVNADGWYSSSLDHIVINSKVLNDPRRLSHVVLHESVHAATANGIEANSSIKDSIQLVMDAVLSEVGDRKASEFGFSGDGLVRDLYALRDNSPLEFLAEAFSNRKFINLLQSVKVPREVAYKLGHGDMANTQYGLYKRDNSVWGNLIEAIRRFLKLPGYESYSALEAIIQPYGSAEYATGEIRKGTYWGDSSAQTKISRLESEALPKKGGVDIEAARKKIFAEAPDTRGRFRRFIDTVRDMYKAGGWRGLADGFAAEASNRYVPVMRLVDRFVAANKARGNQIQGGYDDRFSIAARLSAYASMLDKENTLAKLNTMLFEGGVPVYNVKYKGNPLDGVIKIEGRGGGFTFIPRLQKLGKLQQLAEYAVAKRALGTYKARGLEFQLSEPEARAIVDLYEKDPDIQQAYKELQETNSALIKLAVDSNRLNEKAAKTMLKYNDYFPFWRFVDESGNYRGPSNEKGVLDPSRFKQAEGGTELLYGDPIETLLKNAQFWIGAAQKNIAARKVYEMSKDIGEARQLSFSKAERDAMLDAQFAGDEKAVQKYIQREGVLRPGEMEGSYFVDGIERRIALSNPDVAEALLVTDAPVPDIFKGVFGTFTTGYRELVTRSPEFIFSNIIRDALGMPITSGVSFNIFRPIRNLITFMRDGGNNKSVLTLMQFGGLGGYKSIPQLDDASRLLDENFNPTKGGVYVPKSGKVLTDILAKAWNKLGELSDASDAAPRIAIFDEVYKRTGDDYEAFFRAQDAINYRKQGRNQLLRYLTVMVPFLNGRIQGLDVTARAFGSKQALIYTGIRGGYLFGVAMALQVLFGDDEEYKQLPEYVRYGSLPVPLSALGLGDTGFLAIPKPHELGFIFQTVPETIYQAMLGNVETRSLVKLAGTQLASTFGLSITPQVISPLVETFVQNRSNLTGLPIVTESMKNLPNELQYSSATSQIVKDVAAATGISPVQAEALIKGYTGQIGTTVFGLMDSMYRAATGRGVDKDWTQYPVIQKFLKTEANTNPQGVADVYRLSGEIQGLTTALNTFMAQGAADKAQDLLEKNEGLFGMKSSVSGLRTILNTLSRNERMIVNNPNIPQAEKRAQLEQIREARRQIGKVMTEEMIGRTGK